VTQVREFRLPDLGEGLTEAEIVRWLVEVGDHVSIDQPVVEVETAKAQVEVPCPYGGVVTARYGAEGEELPVGSPLIAVASATPADAEQPSGSGGSSGSNGSGNVLVGYGTTTNGVVSAGGRRRRRARDATTPAPAARPAPARAAVATATTTATAPAPGTPPLPVISPLVRRLAREHGLDLHTVHGSGPDGLILRADVDRAVAAAGAPPASPASPASSADSTRTAPAGTRIPLKGVTGAMADKLSRSRREIPDATCWVDADATELLAARRAMGEPKISLLALLARICTAALARYPQLNATVDADAREIVQLPAVHLGFAAQTERGLVVPVVRDAHTLSTQQLHQEMARLTGLARDGKLPPAQLTGSTFTLNNYGVFGVDGSTPIINHPEAAMLGVGRILEKPWAHQGQLALRHIVQLSFTFDHRVCDGGVAGGFLRFAADCVEQPALLLREL
jgi:pyruvate dehydrogenase E2 component (dihydrolipoamide acetyltransferase)